MPNRQICLNMYLKTCMSTNLLYAQFPQVFFVFVFYINCERTWSHIFCLFPWPQMSVTFEDLQLSCCCEFTIPPERWIPSGTLSTLQHITNRSSVRVPSPASHSPLPWEMLVVWREVLALRLIQQLMGRPSGTSLIQPLPIVIKSSRQQRYICLFWWWARQWLKYKGCVNSCSMGASGYVDTSHCSNGTSPGMWGEREDKGTKATGMCPPLAASQVWIHLMVESPNLCWPDPTHEPLVASLCLASVEYNRGRENAW